MVEFPPRDTTNAQGWTRALLTDLAGAPEFAAELLEAVRDVQAGRITDWSMQYNAYGVQVSTDGAKVTFMGESCAVPLEVIAFVVTDHLQR